LRCGVGPTSNLEMAGDLDNFVVPVADALGRGRVVGTWASKDAGTASTLAVGLPAGTYARHDTRCMGACPGPHDGVRRLGGLEGADRGSDARGSSASRDGRRRTRRRLQGWASKVVAEPPETFNRRARVGAWVRVATMAPPRRQDPEGLSREVDPNLGWTVEIDYWWRHRRDGLARATTGITQSGERGTFGRRSSRCPSLVAPASARVSSVDGRGMQPVYRVGRARLAALLGPAARRGRGPVVLGVRP
jgi:hypothetical protein